MLFTSENLCFLFLSFLLFFFSLLLSKHLLTQVLTQVLPLQLCLLSS